MAWLECLVIRTRLEDVCQSRSEDDCKRSLCHVPNGQAERNRLGELEFECGKHADEALVYPNQGLLQHSGGGA